MKAAENLRVSAADGIGWITTAACFQDGENPKAASIVGGRRGISKAKGKNENQQKSNFKAIKN